MRDDMHKVIVERPRRGAGWARDGRPLPVEDQPSRDKFRRGSQRSKTLNENLAPLKRYLQKQVGRPWDKVYGEIRERISPSNTVQMHIHQHLFDYVERNVTFIDGVPHGSEGSRLVPLGTYRSPIVYVCPKTGLLRSVKRKKR